MFPHLDSYEPCGVAPVPLHSLGAWVLLNDLFRFMSTQATHGN